jgi:hypothetical protein
MPRWLTIVIGVCAVALAIGIAAKTFRAPNAASIANRVDSGTDNTATPSLPGSHAPVPQADPGDRPSDDTRSDSGAAAFAEGAPVPPLPLNAPRQVRFGVVLVSYAGAQDVVNGGHASHRSRNDAKVLAGKLAATAAQDFHSAVQQGDPGSADDVGTVKQGILEPGAEYVLFSLPVEGIGGPVDTPRGYWVVKRLE